MNDSQDFLRNSSMSNSGESFKYGNTDEFNSADDDSLAPTPATTQKKPYYGGNASFSGHRSLINQKQKNHIIPTILIATLAISICVLSISALAYFYIGKIPSAEPSKNPAPNQARKINMESTTIEPQVDQNNSETNKTPDRPVIREKPKQEITLKPRVQRKPARHQVRSSPEQTSPGTIDSGVDPLNESFHVKRRRTDSTQQWLDIQKKESGD